MPNPISDGTDLPSEEQLLDTLKSSVESTFESMLINFSESTSDESQSAESGPSDNFLPSKIEYSSAVKFDGEINGSVVLRFTSSGAQDIARGLLMLEDGDTLEIEDICDALGECANLVSGALKTKALDPVSNFTMSVPTTSGPDAIGESTEDKGKTLAYHLTKGAFTAEVWLD